MKKKSKNILTIVIALLVIAGVFYILTRNKAKNEAETAVVSQTNNYINVQIDTAKISRLSTQHTSNGIFVPFQELQVAATQSGRVAEIYVDEGDQVKKGQTLALIKADELSVQLENAKAAYQTAKSNYNRYQTAFKTGGVTQQQADQASLDLENAKAQLKRARINYGDASIQASIMGVINKRSVEPGTVVNPGTSLFELMNVSKLKLRTNVNENRVANVAIGDTIKVTADALPGKVFKGIIKFIAAKADNSLNFPIEVEVENTNNTTLRAGMYGTINFDSDEKEKLSIPREAFIGSIDNQEVFMMKPDSTVVLKKIVPGSVTENKVEVVSGLEQGDLVVISGQINLNNGSKVNPVKN